MLTPTEKELLIFNSLSQTQKTLATGHVSDLPVLHGNDNAHSLSYFDKDLTKLIQKISLSLVPMPFSLPMRLAPSVFSAALGLL
jgi:hypothetical protein